MAKLVYSVTKAAEECDVSPSAIYEAIKRGLPARKVGKQWRIHSEELRAWFAGSAHTPALAESLAPAVAAHVLSVLGEAFSQLGKKIDSDVKRGGLDV